VSLPPSESAPAAGALPLSELRERQWNGLSKKELEECCVERGLSKKGSKEDLVMRCIEFHQNLTLNKKEAIAQKA